MIPMAISLGYGILFATVISLLLVPSLYLILDDFAAPWRAPARPQNEPRPATVRPRPGQTAGTVIRVFEPP